MFKKIFIILAIAFCVFVASLVGSLCTGVKQEETDVQIVSEIKITSKVRNVITQEYTTTVTGSIKNNTDENLTDLTLKVNGKSAVLGNRQTITIYIDSLQSNKVFTISSQVLTTENLEVVESVTISNSVIGKITLNNALNSIYTFENFLIGIAVISGIVLLIVIIKLITSREKEPVVSKTIKPVLITTPNKLVQNDTELSELEIELKKQKIKKEIEELNKKKEVICPYCGTKNMADNVKCTSCGGSLN